MTKQRGNNGNGFKPGKSGNPKGRPPKGYSITEMMKEMLGSNPELKKELGEAIMQKALIGDMNAVKLMWQYMDGMPVQDVTSGGEKIQNGIIYMPPKKTEGVDSARV